MTLKLKYIGICFLFGLMLLTAELFFEYPRLAGAQVPAGLSAAACTASSTVAVSIGNQLSTVISESASRRAYMRIQQPPNATNTVTIALNARAAAVVGNGLQLTPATSTSPVPVLEFGLATQDPYVGAVTAITNSGSSTILIDQCVY